MIKTFKTIFAVILLCVMLFPSISLAAGSSGGASGWSLGSISIFGLPQGSITYIVMGILSWLLMIFGFVGIIGFIISGLMYILAVGDEKVLEKAKSAMKYSIIGILVGIAGFVVIQAVDMILNAQSRI